MSHYYSWAIIPGDGEVDDLVAATLAPYDENAEIAERTEDGETWKYNPRGMWDWFQIGGRWTGHLAELIIGTPYDPETDPANTETCWLCGGTGVRSDGLTPPEMGCNGCYDPATGEANGVIAKWPTQWRDRRDLDVVPALVITAKLAQLPAKFLPFTIFTHDSGHVTVKTDYSRDDWKEAELTDDDVRRAAMTILSARIRAGLTDDRIVVVVDYHS